MGSTSIKAWPEKGAVFMNGQITNTTAMLVENAISKISATGRKRIYFIISSKEGGDFYAIFKIKSLLEEYNGEVTTVIFGTAFSGGLFLSQIGSKRLATKKSKLCFHQATHTFVRDIVLNAEGLQGLARQLLRIDGVQLQILAARARPVKTVFELFEKEATIDPVEAQKVGLLDQVIKEPKNIEELVSSLTKRGK